MNWQSFFGVKAVPAPAAGAAPGWKPVFAMLALFLAAACKDGYPTKDVPALDPFAMTQDQRLAQMNAVGQSAHPERQWTYSLMPGCILRVDFDGAEGPRPPFHIPLLGAAVHLGADEADGTFDVDVAAHPGGQPSALSVLEAHDWAQARWMHLLVRVVQRGCLDA